MAWVNLDTKEKKARLKKVAEELPQGSLKESLQELLKKGKRPNVKAYNAYRAFIILLADTWYDDILKRNLKEALVW